MSVGASIEFHGRAGDVSTEYGMIFACVHLTAGEGIGVLAAAKGIEAEVTGLFNISQTA